MQGWQKRNSSELARALVAGSRVLLQVAWQELTYVMLLM
jgi:hypothetical protein